MEAKRTATALVLFLCFTFLLWWAISSLEKTPSISTEGETPSSLTASSFMLVVRHFVEDDMHVYEGSILTSTCSVLATGIETEGDTPPRLTVRFSRVQTEGCEGTMAARTVEEPFSIGVTAENTEPLIDRVLVDGSEVAFSVIEE